MWAWLLNERPSLAKFVAGEDKIALCSVMRAEEFCNDEDVVSDGALSFDKVGLVGLKCSLQELQDSCRARKHQVPFFVHDALQLATNQDVQKGAK